MPANTAANQYRPPSLATISPAIGVLVSVPMAASDMILPIRKPSSSMDEILATSTGPRPIPAPELKQKRTANAIMAPIPSSWEPEGKD